MPPKGTASPDGAFEALTEASCHHHVDQQPVDGAEPQGAVPSEPANAGRASSRDGPDSVVDPMMIRPAPPR